MGIMKKNTFDICYCRSLLCAYLIRNKHPFIYEAHISPNRSIYKFLEKKILQHSNLIKLVVICEELKKEYLRLFPFLNKDKILVLHDGADIVSSETKEGCPIKVIDNGQQPFQSNQVKIGYIGHLYPGKCMEVLIQIAKLKRNTLFHVIGGTEEWVNYWKNTLKSQDITNIIFYGFVENQWINECYKQLDIVLLPFSNKIFFNKNKKDDIGKWISPLKLFEAMANGKAIISTCLPSIQEILHKPCHRLLYFQ